MQQVCVVELPVAQVGRIQIVNEGRYHTPSKVIPLVVARAGGYLMSPKFSPEL